MSLSKKETNKLWGYCDNYDWLEWSKTGSSESQARKNIMANRRYVYSHDYQKVIRITNAQIHLYQILSGACNNETRLINKSVIDKLYSEKTIKGLITKDLLRLHDKDNYYVAK